MPIPLEQRITMSKTEFRLATGLGDTKIWQMLRDGRLKAFREGKKVLIIVQSYLDLIAKQQQTGDPGYPGTAAAVEARKAKVAARREARRAEEKPQPTLEDLGL